MINYLDLAFAVALGFFLIRGLFRGFFLEGSSVAGLVLAFHLANTQHQRLVPVLGGWLDNPAVAGVAAYTIMFLGVMFVVGLFARITAMVLRINPARWLSLVGGALLGTAKGLALILVALAMLTFYMPEAQFLKDSMAAKILGPTAGRLHKYLPETPGINPGILFKGLDDFKIKALEEYVGSDPARKKALERFMAEDPETRERELKEFMDADPERRREIMNKYRK